MKLGGPQSDRDRKWNNSGQPPAVEFSKEQVSSTLCMNMLCLKAANMVLNFKLTLCLSICLSMYIQRKKFGGDVGRLQEENNSLKNQLKRALKELQIYQNTYPSAYSSHFNTIHDDDDGEDDDNPHYWSPSTEKLKPLFEAYDTRKHCFSSSI